jgi:hypothetical protein
MADSPTVNYDYGGGLGRQFAQTTWQLSKPLSIDQYFQSVVRMLSAAGDAFPVSTETLGYRGSTFPVACVLTPSGLYVQDSHPTGSAQAERP